MTITLPQGGLQRHSGDSAHQQSYPLVQACSHFIEYTVFFDFFSSHDDLQAGTQAWHGASSVQLQGQLLPGLSLVLAGPDALPLLTFPGNLGEPGTLHEAWRRMEDGGSA